MQAHTVEVAIIHYLYYSVNLKGSSTSNDLITIIEGDICRRASPYGGKTNGTDHALQGLAN